MIWHRLWPVYVVFISWNYGGPHSIYNSEHYKTFDYMYIQLRSIHLRVFATQNIEAWTRRHEYHSASLYDWQ